MCSVKFSKTGQRALLATAMVDAIAIADGWTSLDECTKQAPDRLEEYMKFADAAILALDRYLKQGQTLSLENPQ